MYSTQRKYSDEFNELVERSRNATKREEVNSLYLDMLDFIERNPNGEGTILRRTCYYAEIWKAQTVDD